MIMLRKFGILLILLPVILFARHKDIIYLMDGSEYTGELNKISDTEISLTTPDGPMTFHKDSVRAIDLGTWRPGDDWDTKRDIDDQVLLDALEATSMSSGIRTKYPTAGFITVYVKKSVEIDKDMSSKETIRKIFYITNERGKDEANNSFSYYEDIEDVHVDFARAVARDRNVSTIRDNAIEDGSPYNSLSEYQRLRRKKFAMPGAEVGSVLDFQVTQSTDYNDFLYPSWSMNFYDTEPVLHAEFEIKYHESLEPAITEIEMPVKVKKEKDGEYRILRWTVDNIEPYVEETMLPNLDKFMPNVRVSIPQDMAVISSNFYSKFIEAYDDEAQVKSIIAEKIGPSPSVEDIYNYVSENYATNYVGMWGYYPYPKPLSELLGMAQVARHELTFIFWSFLKAAGKSPEIVLYGPSLDGPAKPEAFNVRSFSSVDVRVQDGDKMLYLDPDEYLRYDHKQPPSNDWILPVKAEGAELEEHPILPGDYTWTKPVYEGSLDASGTLHLDYHAEYHGPIGADSYRRYKYSKPQEVDNSFQEMAKKIDPMANLKDYTLEGYKTLADKVNVSYSVEIPAYAVGAGEEILAFKLPTVDLSAWDVGAQERVLPFSQSGNSYSEKLISFDLPDGYEVEFLHESIEESVGNNSFKGETKVENARLIYHQTSSREHEPLLEPKEYPEYKEFIEKLSRWADNWILIRRKG